MVKKAISLTKKWAIEGLGPVLHRLRLLMFGTGCSDLGPLFLFLWKETWDFRVCVGPGLRPFYIYRLKPRAR